MRQQAVHSYMGNVRKASHNSSHSAILTALRTICELSVEH